MLAWLLVGGSVVTSLLTLYVVAWSVDTCVLAGPVDAPEGALSDATPVGPAGRDGAFLTTSLLTTATTSAGCPPEC